MASTANQESGGHIGRALQQYIKRSPFLHSNILQFLHFQRRNWYPHHNTTTKPPNLAREHINNDQQEREEDIGLPVASKDDICSAGEERDKEELGDVPQSISTPSRNVDELLPPLPFINCVDQLSSRLYRSASWRGGRGSCGNVPKRWWRDRGGGEQEQRLGKQI